MKILVCPDKFKGSLSANEVCSAIASAIMQIQPDAAVECVPLADGGEGTCDLLTAWHHGSNVELQVHGPLFTPLMAHYGLSRDGATAFIEMAIASGLTLMGPEERNPLLTTTLGTGEMIADALRRNVRKIVLAIGGSGTNDAGMGMASALGYKFNDGEGKALVPTGENLIHIRHIDTRFVNPLLKSVEVITLCDVTNPLFGPEGAAHVYGPQKGADKNAVELLDAGLRNFRRVVHKFLKTSVDFPGAGAAGGLGAGTKVFLNAVMQHGVNHVIETTGVAGRIRASDLIITGEGKIDQQTFSGKVVSAVTSLAQKGGKTVVVICGRCDLAEKELEAHGLRKVISLVDDRTTPGSAMTHAATHIREKIIREWQNMLNL